MTSPALDDRMEHVEDRHYRRAKDGDAAPVVGCYYCECSFPTYFAEMREARAAYDRRPYHEPTDHERGHPERPLIGITERAMSEGGTA